MARGSLDARAWVALSLVASLGLAASVRAQDVDTGVVDTGVEVDAGADAGETDAGVDAGVPLDDAGPPSDEQPDVDVALPEGHAPRVELALVPDHDVMTGDVVTARITVTLTEGDDVAVPRQTFGTLELHDQRHTDHPDGDHRVYVFELDFLMLEPGDHELPPVRLRVVTADGVVGTVHTDAATIHVGSLLANEPDAQPRPATAPVPVMQDDYTLAYVFGALGLVALGALLAWLVARWYRRQPKALPPPPPPRPAWEVALEKIEGLRKRLPSALEENKQVEVVDGVSDALREFLGARYDFNGLESTTDEVVARLRHERLGPIALEEVVALLGDADLVKFAKAVPDRETCERMIEGSVRIVRGTMAVSAPAIAQPARPAGRNSQPDGPSKRKKSSAVDERMLAEALKSQKAAEAAVQAPVPPTLAPPTLAPPTLAPPTLAPPTLAPPTPTRDDGRREVPDTNPPAPPPQTPSEGPPAGPSTGPSWSTSTPAHGTRDPNDSGGAS